jgi:hypothetical protein
MSLRLVAVEVDPAFLVQRAIEVLLVLLDHLERMAQRAIKETVDPQALKVLLERKAIPALEALPVLLERTVSPVR